MDAGEPHHKLNRLSGTACLFGEFALAEHFHAVDTLAGERHQFHRPDNIRRRCVHVNTGIVNPCQHHVHPRCHRGGLERAVIVARYAVRADESLLLTPRQCLHRLRIPLRPIHLCEAVEQHDVHVIRTDFLEKPLDIRFHIFAGARHRLRRDGDAASIYVLKSRSHMRMTPVLVCRIPERHAFVV